MPRRPQVTVLGSLNTDISVGVPHLPGPGETVLAASGAVVGAGGKGANQAVAAARLGAQVRMVGCCGSDEFGGRLRAGLAAEGVDVGGVRTVAGAASGLALITVDAAGENTIAVAPGANGQAGAAEVAAVLATPCDVLILSAEIPVPTLAAALSAVHGRAATVLNLAPVPEGAHAVAAEAGWLVLNAQEAQLLAATQVADVATAQVAAASLAASGADGQHVVITMGPAGAVLAGPGGTATVPGFPVRSVDSVGAGDAFVAALAVALASGVGPGDAVRAACAAGAAATTRRGAQTGLPRPADVLAATGFGWPVIG